MRAETSFRAVVNGPIAGRRGPGAHTPHVKTVVIVFESISNFRVAITVRLVTARKIGCI
jgi:hypothetical protein